MKFGKELNLHLENTLPQWRDKYLCYKLLKKLLKIIIPNGNDEGDANTYIMPFPELQVLFVQILCQELHKFNDFYVDKEEEFVIRLQALKERIEELRERLRENPDGLFALETEFSQEMMEMRENCVSIHGEMILLKNYSSINFIGLTKILKKYDKRTRAWLRLPFIQLAFYQPFFKTEQLTKLVRECEANLTFLFPQGEVGADGQRRPTNAAAVPTSLVGEETQEIYLSTLAAIGSIEGLRRASSTYNPLSISYIFGGHDNETTSDGVPAQSSAQDSGIRDDASVP